jgi:hypothetical protein
LDGTHFVARAWAIKGQQPFQVRAEYAPWYVLNGSFPESICSDEGYSRALTEIRALAASRVGVAPPLYLLLLRPPRDGVLQSHAPLIASTPVSQLYDVGQP